MRTFFDEGVAKREAVLEFKECVVLFFEVKHTVPSLRSLAMFARLISILSLFVSSACFAEAAKRPNILFCFADDWGRYASCYKGLDGRPNLNDVVKTPNIDRIAGRGVVFTNAFV